MIKHHPLAVNYQGLYIYIIIYSVPVAYKPSFIEIQIE